MIEKLKTTTEGLIYIKSSIIISLKKPNSVDGAKVLGKPVIINVNHIGFLSHNIEGHVTFFMANGFEITMNVFYNDAEIIFNAAKSNIVKIIG